MNILPDLPRTDVETFGGEFRQQFGLKQMHMPEIGSRGIPRDAGPVFHRHAGVSAALHPQPRPQGDPKTRLLAETMAVSLADRHDNPSRHYSVSPPSTVIV